MVDFGVVYFCCFQGRWIDAGGYGMDCTSVGFDLMFGYLHLSSYLFCGLLGG